MYDCVVIGGGIIGASTAWQLMRRFPGQRLLLLEKEPSLARHQTGRNSGVIHSGIYYAPGSLKSELCRAGLEATVEFCEANDIPYEQCGKLLVATSAEDDDRMHALFRRAAEVGVSAELLDESRLRELEPNIVGSGAILVPATGIVDYRAIAARMAGLFTEAGGETRLGAEVIGIRERSHAVEIRLAGTARPIEARFLVACGGLMADRLAQMQGLEIDFQIVPYRGEYYRLPAARQGLIRHLIYPIPDPTLPFLGIHLTRTIDGNITVGPNAVQGWKREGYGRLNFSARDVAAMMRFPGFWRVLRNNLGTGARETWHSVWKRGYLERVRKYCPGLRLDDLRPHPVGIRAQAVMRDGSIAEDFLFAESERSLHVCSAPSPAATAAIPIGARIAARVPAES